MASRSLTTAVQENRHHTSTKIVKGNVDIRERSIEKRSHRETFLAARPAAPSWDCRQA